MTAFRRGEVPDDLFEQEPMHTVDVTQFVPAGKLIDKGASKRRTPTISDKEWEIAKKEAWRRMQSANWEGAQPRVFAALYALLHERVYSVAPSELTPQIRAYATGAAKRMLAREFDDKPEEMAVFMRWAWMREQKREAWRRENNRDGGRISWTLQFNGSLITDWRLEQSRKPARAS